MAKKVSSRIEKIGGKEYIVERRKDGSIICKSLYERPSSPAEKEIDVSSLSEIEFRKLMLQKQGYRIKEVKFKGEQ